MFGGVRHKNVTQRIGIGARVRNVRAQECVREGSRDCGGSDCDSRGGYWCSDESCDCNGCYTSLGHVKAQGIKWNTSSLGSSCCAKYVFWAPKFNLLFTMMKKQPAYCVLCCWSQISSPAINLSSTTPEGLQGGPSLGAQLYIQFFECLNYCVMWQACGQSACHLNLILNPDWPVCLLTFSLVTCPMTEWLWV